jgi:serine/threonine-protein kinase RsbT
MVRTRVYLLRHIEQVRAGHGDWRPAILPGEGPVDVGGEAAMGEARRVAINNDLDVVAARVEGRNLAREMGFGIIDQARIATAISELARNAVAYACGGEIILERIELDGQVGLQIVCIDQGPGIENLEEVLRGLHGDMPELGMGLRGTRRLLDEFEIDSKVGVGTTVRVCKWLR